MSEKKAKKKKTKRYIEYGVLILFVGLLFTTDLRAEVFGFMQRGMLKLGLFKPNVENLSTGQSDEGEDAVAQSETYDMPLKDQDGNPVDLADLDDKVVFINFWATWCPPCIAEMPEIDKLYQDYADDDEVVFLMVSLDQGFDKAKDWAADKGFDFNVHEPQGNIPSDFENNAIPTTYVIDKKGNMAYSHIGIGDYNTKSFRKKLDKLKAE